MAAMLSCGRAERGDREADQVAGGAPHRDARSGAGTQRPYDAPAILQISDCEQSERGRDQRRQGRSAESRSAYKEAVNQGQVKMRLHHESVERGIVSSVQRDRTFGSRWSSEPQ